jgi:hypothetical protein
MRFKVTLKDGTSQIVEGREAFPVIKRAFGYMCNQIMMPIPPHTTKIRSRAAAALRRGESVSDSWDDEGQPNGQLVLKVLQ